MKQVRRKLLSLALTLSMLCSICVPTALADNETAGDSRYSDTQGHWAEAAIDRWSGYGIVEGYGSGFHPDESITRAQMATILSNLLGLTETSGNPFSDVSEGDWYSAFILRCYAAGVMAGDNGKANPNDLITREQAMVMLSRALGVSPAENADLSAFVDSGSVSSWAAPFVAAMVSSGMVAGVGDSQLAPQSSMTRAAALTVLNSAVTQYINAPGSYELSSGDGIILVASGDVTLTGTTSANILITPAADGKAIAFTSATITGTVTVQADNAAITAKDSTLPVFTYTGTGSTYTDLSAKKTSGSSGGSGGGSTTYASPVVTGDTLAAGTYQAVTISPDVGDGNVTLTNVKIVGDLTIQGGGSNSIYLNNCTIGGKVIMAKDPSRGEPPRLHLTGTPVKAIEVQQPAIIAVADAASQVTSVEANGDTTIYNLSNDAQAVAAVTAKAPVIVSSGAVGKVTVPKDVTAPVSVTVKGSATVGQIEAKGQTALNTESGAIVSTITVQADVAVTGAGSVTTIDVPEDAAAVAISVTDAAVGEIAVKSDNGAAITTEGDATISTVSDPKQNTTVNGDKSQVADHTHVWGEAKVTAATYLTTGTSTKTCSVCGTSISTEIPRLGTDAQHQTIDRAVTAGLLKYLPDLDRLDSVTRLDMARLIAAFADLSTDTDAYPFTDGDTLTHQDKSIVTAVAAATYIVGKDAATFAPSDTMTRAEVTKVIYRALGEPTVDTDHPFTDVSDEAWYAPSVEGLYTLGIPIGKSDGVFAPEETATIEDALTWLLKTKDLQDAGMIPSGNTTSKPDDSSDNTSSKPDDSSESTTGGETWFSLESYGLRLNWNDTVAIDPDSSDRYIIYTTAGTDTTVTNYGKQTYYLLNSYLAGLNSDTTATFAIHKGTDQNNNSPIASSFTNQLNVIISGDAPEFTVEGQSDGTYQIVGTDIGTQFFYSVTDGEKGTKVASGYTSTGSIRAALYDGCVINVASCSIQISEDKSTATVIKSAVGTVNKFTTYTFEDQTVDTFEALRSALALGGKVTLNADITSTVDLSVSTGAASTLVLNGHTLDIPQLYISSGKELTIDGTAPGSTIAYTGGQNFVQASTCSKLTIEGGAYQQIRASYARSVTLTNVTATAENQTVDIGHTDQIVITDSTFDATATGDNVSYQTLFFSSAGTIAMDGVKANGYYYAMDIYGCTGATITNSTFTGEVRCLRVMKGSAELTNVTATAGRYEAIDAQDGGKITINSGAYTSHAQAVSLTGSTDSSVTINGGDFQYINEDPSSTYKPDIAYANEESHHTLTISGGTFTGYGSIIQYSKPASVTVTGGTYDFDPSAEISDGATATQNDGTWTVSNVSSES